MAFSSTPIVRFKLLSKLGKRSSFLSLFTKLVIAIYFVLRVLVLGRGVLGLGS